MDSMPSSIPTRTLPFKIALFANVLIIAVSLLSLIGWASKALALASWSPGFIPMAQSTALLFFSFGMVLLANTVRPRWKALTLVMALLALTTMVCCIRVLFSEVSTESLLNLAINKPLTAFPLKLIGTMSPLTAVGLISVAFFLLLPVFPRRNILTRAASETIAFAVFCLGFICSVGYFYGMPLLYGSAITPMALPTALVFMILAVRLMVNDPTGSYFFRLFTGRSIQSRLFRTFLPVVMFLMVLTGWLFCRLFPRKDLSFNVSVFGSIITLLVLFATGCTIAFLSRRLGRDIDNAHKAVQESEQKFRGYIENAPDGVSILDNTGRYVEANKAFCALTGYSEEDLLQLNIRDLFAVESMEDGLAHFNKIKETGFASADLYHKRQNGSLVCLLVKAVKLNENRIIGFAKDVTGLKQAESEREEALNTLKLNNEKLQESEKRYRNLFDNAGQAIFIAQDGMIKFANPITCKLSGYSDQELFSKPFKELVHPDDRDMVIKRHTARLKGEDVPPLYSFRMLTKDGGALWAELNAVLIEWEGGPATLNFISDITERVQTDELIKKNSLRLRSIVDIMQRSFKNAKDLLDFALDEGIKLTESKIGYIYLYSEERNEFTLNTWSKGVMNECSIEHSPTMYHLEKTGIWGEAVRQRRPIVVNDFHAENPLKKGYPRGHAALHNFMTVPVFINGKIKGVAGVANKPSDYDETDVLQLTLLMDGAWKVSERMQAEQDLRASEEKYRNLLENSLDGICISHDNRIVFANKSLLKMFGYDTVEEFAAISMEDHAAPESKKNILERFEKRNRGETIPSIFGMIGIRKDGATIDLELSSFESTINNEKYLQNTVRDVTEKRKLAESMQRTDKLEALSILAGGIAHDFNNLLGGIFGYIDMAREEIPAGGAASKFLDKAIRVFDRAKDLTQQLLTFSKGGAPKLKTGQLGPLIKQCASFSLSGSNVSCEFHIAEGLWPCNFDENQIGQVIDNIVINAHQAMPQGGKIAISAGNVVLKNGELPVRPEGGDFVKISIADNGMGIPGDLLKRIFDPFFTTKQKGHGLGLSTCFSIVQKHKGAIDVESQQGKGSVFHVFLPASQKEINQNVSQRAYLHKSSGTILVMDDEDFMREIIGAMLMDMGYSVVQAKNGEEAIRLAIDAVKTNRPFSAAVLDLTVPGGMGGKEVGGSLLKECPGMPVFASSGFSEDPVMSRPQDYGFTDSIRKPYLKNELAEVLNRHLKTSSPSLLLGKEKGEQATD